MMRINKSYLQSNATKLDDYGEDVDNGDGGGHGVMVEVIVVARSDVREGRRWCERRVVVVAGCHSGGWFSL